MATPIDPSMEDPERKIQRHHDRPAEGKIHPRSEEAKEFKKHADVDPHGIWEKFLTTQGGGSPSKEEVEMFIQSYTKILNVTVQQNRAAFERQKQRWKDAGEGKL